MDVCADRGKPFLPVTAESGPDSEHIGFRDIWIPGKYLLQFFAPKAKAQHLLLNVHWKLRVWNNRFRQDCMGMPAMLAPNPQDFICDSPKLRFETPLVISVADQATGMSTAAADAVEFKIGDNLCIVF